MTKIIGTCPNNFLAEYFAEALQVFASLCKFWQVFACFSIIYFILPFTYADNFKRSSFLELMREVPLVFTAIVGPLFEGFLAVAMSKSVLCAGASG